MRFTSALFCASLLCGQISDTTPPVLAALDFTPRSVDVTAAPKTVNITARITDNLSGFSYAPSGLWALRISRPTIFGRLSYPVQCSMVPTRWPIPSRNSWNLAYGSSEFN